MLVNVAKITQLRNQVVDSFSDEQKQNEDEEYQKFVDELVKKGKNRVEINFFKKPIDKVGLK